MDSLKSDSNPLAKVPATVDVATVDPSVDMVLPTSGTPLLATISGGSFSASPKESDQPISTVTTSNAWSKPLSITQPSSAATVLMQTSKELIADLSRETQWPSLSAANCAPSRRRQPVARAINASRPSPHNSYSSSVTAKVPLVPSASVVAVNTPTGSFTEKVHVSCTPSEIVQVTHVTAVTDEKELPPPTVVSVSPNDETCKQLDVAEPVDSSTQSVPPTPEAPSGKFVGNVDIVVDNSNSSPSSVPFVHDNLFAVLDSADASEPSSVPPAKELVFSNSPLPFTFASHDTSPTHPRDPFVDDESTLRSRGGRPLKPSQRLKEMEWFTVTGKGKRGRGRGPHH
ncbi:BnaA06g33760D [Brassica napus]|uniref:BnaA06g33760D protein n=1 Tax=Brassica napus TaxID=3708 RepID=A0A078I547_BRANA|nr:BnaC04g13480D [Brassica napus]CDY26626.1 BnaA09g46510D [Brassica napus]CDY45172.1 BnaA06g33760D [Brassica napus]